MNVYYVVYCVWCVVAFMVPREKLKLTCKEANLIEGEVLAQPAVCTFGKESTAKKHGVFGGWKTTVADIRDLAGFQSDNLVRGIDYLPDFVKRRQSRKKHLPKFLRVDPHSWSMSYMHFLNHKIQTDTPGCSRTTSRSTSRELSPVIPHDDDIFSARRVSRALTPDTLSITDEAASDWRTYEQFKFENLVMSGGGSKGYAYIGALKVS